MNVSPNIFENKLSFTLSGCCTILAFVLIFLEFRTFFAKPTSIEQTTTGLNFRLAPQVMFCLQPAFNMETLHHLGFNGISQKNLVFGSSLTEVSNILNEVVITDKFPGTFQFFFGNIGTKDMPKDYQYGWTKLTNKTSIEEYFSIFQSVSDLIYKASMLYRDENKVKHYVHLQPKILRLSYPVGSCLRYIY